MQMRVTTRRVSDTVYWPLPVVPSKGTVFSGMAPMLMNMEIIVYMIEGALSSFPVKSVSHFTIIRKSM